MPPAEALGGPVPHLFQLLGAVSIPGLAAAQLLSLPLSSHGPPSPVCLIRTFITGFRAHPHNRGQSHFKILNYICKDLFFFSLNKVTFTVSGEGSECGHTFFWGGHHSIPYKVILPFVSGGWREGCTLVSFFFSFYLCHDEYIKSAASTRYLGM